MFLFEQPDDVIAAGVFVRYDADEGNASCTGAAGVIDCVAEIPDRLTGERGSNTMTANPSGPPMGHVVARRGHMTLLPVGAAYRFTAEKTSVILLQTQDGPETVYRWAEIIKTVP